MSYREMWGKVDALRVAGEAVVGRLNEAHWNVLYLENGELEARCRLRTGPLAHKRVRARTLNGLEAAVARAARGEPEPQQESFA